MAVSGLVDRFHTIFSQASASAEMVTNMVIAVALLSLALGVRLPQRLLLWVCASAWRRFVKGGPPSQMSTVLLDPEEADRPLFWVVLSVVALAAGVLIALLPQVVELTARGYAWMLTNFLWSAGPLAALQAMIVLLASVVPLAVLGLAVSCVHHLGCLYGRWETRATAWLLIGGAGALLVGHSATSGSVQGDLALAVAAIPALMTSVVSATARSARSGSRRGKRVHKPVPLPIWSDRAPTLLRASIVALACLGVYAVAVWTRHLSAETGGSTIPAAIILFALGLGILTGFWRAGSRRISIGGFGVVCALASIGVAASTLGTARIRAVGPGLGLLAGCVDSAIVGFATACGWHTLLGRVAQRSVAGATILARMLTLGGLTVWVVAPVADRLLGTPTALMLAALSLAALGGALILREPSYAPEPPRARGVQRADSRVG